MKLLLLTALASVTFWTVQPTQQALKASLHTHVQVTGVIQRKYTEADGDIHIWICTSLTAANTTCVLGEVIPELKLAIPPIGTLVKVQGIARRDPEHQWFEIHPVTSISIVTP